MAYLNTLALFVHMEVTTDSCDSSEFSQHLHMAVYAVQKSRVIQLDTLSIKNIESEVSSDCITLYGQAIAGLTTPNIQRLKPCTIIFCLQIKTYSFV